ncbi:MAG: hypothetical protein WB507_03200 [Solirubrobacterales bacterium]
MPFELEHVYDCKPLKPWQHCPHHADRYQRPDRIYLLPNATGEWRIAKGGAILEDISLTSPDNAEYWLYPPATPADLARPAQLPTPEFSCEGKRLAGTVAESQDDVINSEYETVHGVPWLQINSVAIRRTSRSSVCVAISLASPPHPDAQYSVTWVAPLTPRANPIGPPPPPFRPINRGGIAGWGEPNVQIKIDADGVAHANMNDVGVLTQPRLSSVMPRFGILGLTLEIELTPRQGFLPWRTWDMKAYASDEPTQTGEPLLPHGIDATDRAPYNECMRYPQRKIVPDPQCEAPSG